MNKKTNKTAHVLKLLTNTEGVVKENPILNEDFKDEMILNRNSSQKSEQKSEAIENIKPQKTMEVNIVSELIEENLEEILKRFRCCDCEKCKSYISVEALNQIPPKYALDNGNNAKEIEKIKESYKSNVISVLVKIALKLKNSPIH